MNWLTYFNAHVQMAEYLHLTRWEDTTEPCLDADSIATHTQGTSSIPAFQTHSRFFYLPSHEQCCGRQFVELFYLQFHKYPPCQDCAVKILTLASEICWQCRTYFRRYGTGAMKQIVGYTDQRHDYQNVFHPESGRDQWRFPREAVAQAYRDRCLSELPPAIVGQLLPGLNACPFWSEISDFLHTFAPGSDVFYEPNIMLMPYHSENALLPLPPSPFYIVPYQSVADELPPSSLQPGDTPPPV